ncbi:MAG TPA: phage baseplate assembly protein V [Sphingobium sp.]|uniref:phage baseplate assembly protein V n=1 Tax=Sphingobium sp. TaxID=1912891 RepID=UPI002ED5AB9A
MRHLIRNLVGIGRVRLTDDTGPVQMLQGDEGQSDPSGKRWLLDKVRKVAHFGFVSVPPLSSEIVMIRPNGDRASSIAVGSNHQPSRVKNLKPGDTGMHDVRGQKIMLTEAGTEIDCQGLPCRIINASTVTIDAPEVHITGNLHVDGEITGFSGGDAVALGALRDAYNQHRHTDTQPGAGTTGNTDQAV